MKGKNSKFFVDFSKQKIAKGDQSLNIKKGYMGGMSYRDRYKGQTLRESARNVKNRKMNFSGSLPKIKTARDRELGKKEFSGV